MDKYRDFESFGFDFAEKAIDFCKLRKLNNILKASVSEIPFKNDSFNIILSLDVLYHLGVKDDIQALSELWRVLKKDGIIIINLPAYNFLKGSNHNKAVHVRHRYTRSELTQKLEEIGFKIEKITYRNTILFPLALVKRLVEKILPSKREIKSDLNTLPVFVNILLTQILFFENRLLSILNLPFGLSIFCIARK